jgi:hypothetical protein
MSTAIGGGLTGKANSGGWLIAVGLFVVLAFVFQPLWPLIFGYNQCATNPADRSYSGGCARNGVLPQFWQDPMWPEDAR